MANNYFKISMHALAVGGAAAFMILLGLGSQEAMGIPVAASTFIAGLVCTSRLIVSDHQPGDVYSGLFVGFLSQLVAYYFIM